MSYWTGRRTSAEQPQQKAFSKWQTFSDSAVWWEKTALEAGEQHSSKCLPKNITRKFTAERLFMNQDVLGVIFPINAQDSSSLTLNQEKR